MDGKADVYSLAECIKKTLNFYFECNYKYHLCGRIYDFLKKDQTKIKNINDFREKLKEIEKNYGKYYKNTRCTIL